MPSRTQRDLLSMAASDLGAAEWMPDPRQSAPAPHPNEMGKPSELRRSRLSTVEELESRATSVASSAPPRYGSGSGMTWGLRRGHEKWPPPAPPTAGTARVFKA